MEQRSMGTTDDQLPQHTHYAELLRMGERLAHVGSWELDLRSGDLVWSDELYRILGLEPGAIEPSYQELLERFHPDDVGAVSEQIERGLASGKPFSYQARLVLADGTIRHISAENAVVVDEDGTPSKAFGIAHDVSETVLADQELASRIRQQAAVAELGGLALATESFDDLLDHTAELVARTLDVPYTKILELLPGGSEIVLRAGFGWPREYMGAVSTTERTKTQSGFTLHSDEPVIVDDLRTDHRFGPHPFLLRHGVISGVSVVIRTAEGPYGVLGADSTTHRTFTDDDVTFLQAVANVLAEALRRMEADRALRASEERYRGLFEGVPVGVYRVTPDGRLLEGNPALARILGFGSIEETKRFRAERYWHDPLERAEWRRRLEEAGELAGYEARHRGPDGSMIWIRDTARVVHDAAGAPLYYEGILQDFTEARQATDALRETNAALHTLIASSPVPIITLDRDRIVTEWNPAAEQAFGWSAAEVVGKPYPLVPPEHRDEHLAYQEAILGGATFAGEEVRRLRKDGSTADVSFSAAPLQDAFGRITGSIAVLADVTERRRTERELRDSLERLRATDEQRRALLGHLSRAQEEERKRIAGDIHDDSIQIMAAAGMRLSTLRRRLGDDAAVEDVAAVEHTVRQSIARLRHLMFELRPPSLDRDGLGAALQLYLDAMGRSAEGGPTWHLEDGFLTEPSSETRAMLYRIAQEALTNARKHAKATHVDVALSEESGGYRLTVSDDGAGFTPNESPPQPGHLGLTAMRERAEIAGGTFGVVSSPGQGTVVEAWIPDAAGEAA
jgi:PAS domain S-box-containing protein